jgi:puromycin-sensitive aminopeptidase
MLYAILGHETFQHGLRLYMDKHQYGNTETIDLWNAWSTASGRPIKELMASWTEQMGYPMLRVLAARWHPEHVTLDIEQQWFLADGSAGDDRLWTVPLPIAASAAGFALCEVPFKSTKTFSVDVKLGTHGPQDWIKLNGGQTVPMRVAYTPDLLERLRHGVM